MKLQRLNNFYAGTSNIVLPVPNKSFFPPKYRDKTRLNYYASLFNSVEINSSFYKVPLPRTVEKWTTEVPPNFRFSFKLSKAITHAKELDYDPAAIPAFLEAIAPATKRKGCLLVQFPASIKVSRFQKVKRLMDLLQEANSKYEWPVAIEFRDKSWYTDNVYEMLEQYQAAVVVHDMPASATPLIDMDCAFFYMRFHGQKGDYRGSYDEDVLEERAQNIKDRVTAGKTVYFNNTMGEAVHNLATLNRLYR